MMTYKCFCYFDLGSAFATAIRVLSFTQGMTLLRRLVLPVYAHTVKCTYSAMASAAFTQHQVVPDVVSKAPSEMCKVRFFLLL